MKHESEHTAGGIRIAGNLGLFPAQSGTTCLNSSKKLSVRCLQYGNRPPINPQH